MFKKIQWIIKRHPFLYLTRFKLLSRNATSSEIMPISYNSFNKKTEVPVYFKEINDLIFQNHKSSTDFDLILKLSIWLYEHIEGGSGLSEPSDKALKMMLLGQGGVCSDVVQSFNNFCVLNDIQVREWGTTRAPFDRSFGGHSFSEVYSKELKKWFLIDVHHCIIFFDAEKVPQSVLEVFASLKSSKPIEVTSYNSKKDIEDAAVFRNFSHPDTIPFLISNYSNRTYDAYLKKFRPYLPVFVIHFWLYLINKSYYYLFPLSDYKKIFN